MTKLRIAVLASGNGSNLQAIIDAIEEKRINVEIAIVISDKKDAYALTRAQNHKIKTLYLPVENRSQEDYDRQVIEYLQKEDTASLTHIELIVLAGFMRILSPYFIKAYPNRIMNIHPSLLPSFPGISAQKQALDYGVKVSGVTVHFVDEGCDTGPIILQKAVDVLDSDTEQSLSERILAEEHKIYPQAIEMFAQGRLDICGHRVKIRQELLNKGEQGCSIR